MAVSYKKLWKLLIDRNMKKKDLRTAANISTTTLARLGKDENVSTEILSKICTAAFVLDFINNPADIQKSFERYYKTTVLSSETDANKLNDLVDSMEPMQVYTDEDILNMNHRFQWQRKMRRHMMPHLRKMNKYDEE